MSIALANTAQITARYVRAFLRQPYYIVGTLVQPVTWLLLFGQLFQRATELPGFTSGSYISFLTPGIIVMSAMLSAGWSGTSYVIDMERGVMNRFLVSPVRRSALIGGQLVYQAGMVLLQSLIILGLGLLVGARFSGGLIGIFFWFFAQICWAGRSPHFSTPLTLCCAKQRPLSL